VLKKLTQIYNHLGFAMSHPKNFPEQKHKKIIKVACS